MSPTAWRACADQLWEGKPRPSAAPCRTHNTRHSDWAGSLWDGRNGRVVMFKVMMLGQNGHADRACSCDLPTYRAALQWVRDYWTRDDGELLTAIRIVRIA